MSTEREDLESLIASPGFLRLQDYARKTWRDRYPERIKLAVTNARVQGIDLEASILAIDAETEAVNLLLSYPQSRIDVLLKQAVAEHAEPMLSRRGTL